MDHHIDCKYLLHWFSLASVLLHMNWTWYTILTVPLYCGLVAWVFTCNKDNILARRQNLMFKTSSVYNHAVQLSRRLLVVIIIINKNMSRIPTSGNAIDHKTPTKRPYQTHIETVPINITLCQFWWCLFFGCHFLALLMTLEETS